MGALTARLLAVASITLVVAACADSGGGDTLQPLPIEGGTIAPVTVTPTSTVAGQAFPPPSAVSAGPTGGAATTTSSTAVEPVGDWDGASFDVGTIAAVTDLGGRRAIDFDRWSYTGPDGVTVDAAGLRAEPLAAWWRASPFSNVRVQLRTFFLAPDVEVLALDPSGRALACAEPAPATPTAPRWIDSSVDALDDAAGTSIATLTYSATGEVTRVRLTNGC